MSRWAAKTCFETKLVFIYTAREINVHFERKCVWHRFLNLWKRMTLCLSGYKAHRMKYTLHLYITGCQEPAFCQFHLQKNIDTDISGTFGLTAALVRFLPSVSPQVVQPFLQIGVGVGQGRLRLGFLPGHRQASSGAREVWQRAEWQTSREENTNAASVNSWHLRNRVRETHSWSFYNWEVVDALTWQFIGQIQTQLVQHLGHDGVTAPRHKCMRLGLVSLCHLL